MVLTTSAVLLLAAASCAYPMYGSRRHGRSAVARPPPFPSDDLHDAQGDFVFVPHESMPHLPAERTYYPPDYYPSYRPHYHPAAPPSSYYFYQTLNPYRDPRIPNYDEEDDQLDDMDDDYQEKWYERGPNGAANAAFLDNLIAAQMVNDKLHHDSAVAPRMPYIDSRYGKDDSDYIYGEPVTSSNQYRYRDSDAFGSYRYRIENGGQAPAQAQDDDEDEDEDVRQLHALRKKSHEDEARRQAGRREAEARREANRRAEEFRGNVNGALDDDLEDLFSRSGMPSLLPSTPESKIPIWNGATAGASIDHLKSNFRAMHHDDHMIGGNQARKPVIPVVPLAPSITTPTPLSTTTATPAPRTTTGPVLHGPGLPGQQGSQPEVAMLRPAAPGPVRTPIFPVLPLPQVQISPAHHNAVDEVRNLLRVQEDAAIKAAVEEARLKSYLAMLTDPELARDLSGAMDASPNTRNAHRPQKRFVTNEDALVEELNALKKKSD